jgi:hypothetical protein
LKRRGQRSQGCKSLDEIEVMLDGSLTIGSFGIGRILLGMRSEDIRDIYEDAILDEEDGVYLEIETLNLSIQIEDNVAVSISSRGPLYLDSIDIFTLPLNKLVETLGGVKELTGSDEIGTAAIIETNNRFSVYPREFGSYLISMFNYDFLVD